MPGYVAESSSIPICTESEAGCHRHNHHASAACLVFLIHLLFLHAFPPVVFVSVSSRLVSFAGGRYDPHSDTLTSNQRWRGHSGGFCSYTLANLNSTETAVLFTDVPRLSTSWPLRSLTKDGVKRRGEKMYSKTVPFRARKATNSNYFQSSHKRRITCLPCAGKLNPTKT